MQSSNSAKFTDLLKPHYNDALRYSRALCAGWSPDDAEDVLQQSFLLALENFESLKDTSKFRSWFFKIITTTFYSSVRRHFWKKFLPISDEASVVENMPDVYDRAEQSETREVLSKALAKLSVKERSAILLFEIADFSIEEITAIQKEKSISAVKSRLSRTREKLRKLITEEGNTAKNSAANKNSASNKNFLKSKHSSAANEEHNSFAGDIEHETLKLINEIRTER
jgi:RNA polymerase sigma-70 factor (ECF subfamily)